MRDIPELLVIFRIDLVEMIDIIALIRFVGHLVDTLVHLVNSLGLFDVQPYKGDIDGREGKRLCHL